ncbi:hypothetical protein TIFTF001_051477 [Ficus carica]|uniref:CCHC-type domain-containing protein n=1 Tax=Ficus carica TaxID=3494 RepID=A0AA87YXN1_FICCA|nr:hypothetical protein TIFTF001_051477 [Ficus carica]
MCRKMTTMSWQYFVAEFRAMYYNRKILTAQQDEFNIFRQGSMTVIETVKKFEQLARLFPELLPNETEKVRRMMKMFRTDIAKQVSAGSNPPTLVSDYISQAIRAEYWINQDKKARAQIFRAQIFRAQIFKAKKEEKAIVKHPQPRQNPEFYSKGQSSNVGQNTRQFGKNKRKGNVMSQGQQRSYPQKKVNRGNGGNNNNSDSHPVCAQCGKRHAGVCRSGSNACYICDKEGHYARNCTLSNQNLNPQFQNRNPSSQLNAVQVKIEGLSLAQGRLEAPEPQARIYAYTKADVEVGTSSVVTGQTSVTTYNALALLNSGVTHSFVLKEFAQKLGTRVDSLEHP